VECVGYRRTTQPRSQNGAQVSAGASAAYKRQNPAACKVDAHRPYLRERWERGVHNARKLLDEIRERGYGGGYSQLKLAVAPWREEERERAFVRFETGPGEHYGKSRVMVRSGAAPAF
jgi:transposase